MFQFHFSNATVPPDQFPPESVAPFCAAHPPRDRHWSTRTTQQGRHRLLKYFLLRIFPHASPEAPHTHNFKMLAPATLRLFGRRIRRAAYGIISVED